MSCRHSIVDKTKISHKEEKGSRRRYKHNRRCRNRKRASARSIDTKGGGCSACVKLTNVIRNTKMCDVHEEAFCMATSIDGQ